MEKSIRSRATTRNRPTPAATARMSTALGMDCTWFASTCRSGSEMVIIKPSRKPRGRMIHSFFVRVMRAPSRSPMGSMASSAPRVKNIIPASSSSAPARKASRMLAGMGARVTDSSSTMATMGRTAFRASCHFSCNFPRYNAPVPFRARPEARGALPPDRF